MSLGAWFSPARFAAMVGKEFVQMLRDRVTLALMLGIPMMQLILFGYAINSDPKRLPLAVLASDQGVLARTLISAMQVSDYFRLTAVVRGEAEADRLLQEGEVQFVLNLPPGFYRDVVRGLKPTLLLEADATDPAAVSNAVGALQNLANQVLQKDLKGLAAPAPAGSEPLTLMVHRRYNPEGLTRFNIVPGLMGVVLTMTMVIITSLAVTRERERGTMENLLTTPVRPLEVLLGKLMPYILVGYVQVGLILIAAKLLFGVPMLGSVPLLLAVSIIFIGANLAVGITFSTVAQNQLQAVQMAFFFFLPSIMLSGFMFPFRGMPDWAQSIGSFLPLTHYLRLVRGILLKGNTLAEAASHMWPIALFTVVVLTLGLKRYRRTLD